MNRASFKLSKAGKLAAVGSMLTTGTLFTGGAKPGATGQTVIPGMK